MPILKLGNVDTSVKSIYVGWYNPKTAFDFKLELRNSADELIGSYEDRTISALTANNTPNTTIADVMNSVHGEWNIGKVDLSHLTWTDTTTDTTNGPWTYTAPGGYSLSTDKYPSGGQEPYKLFDNTFVHECGKMRGQPEVNKNMRVSHFKCQLQLNWKPIP